MTLGPWLNLLSVTAHAPSINSQPFDTQYHCGKFMVRVPPEIHRDLAIQAAESGISLNRLASAKLSK